jgi:hypothetical protein
MTESKPRFSLAAPPPKVVLLPDGFFFTRAVPVTAASTPEEVATQAELAIEALAPFPIAQMYQGYFWRPGAAHALVFAAYRKRFPAEQTAEWEGAELVAPAFAMLLGAEVETTTTVILHSPEGMTLLHWPAAGAAPGTVLTRALPAEAGFSERAEVRAELLRAVGEKAGEVIEWETPPEFDPEASDGAIGFRAGALKAAYSREALEAIDVRDKDDLAVRRRARRRDLLLWRIFLGSAVALAFALALELVMLGGTYWQRGRTRIVDGRAPQVAEINRANELATRIEELSTKRLLPFEMLDLVAAQKPASVTFTRVTATTDALYTLEVRGQTNASSDVVAYQASLAATSEVREARVEEQDIRGGLTTFRLKITFQDGAVKGADQS